MLYYVIFILMIIVLSHLIWSFLFVIGTYTSVKTSENLLDVAIAYTISVVLIVFLYIGMCLLNRVLFKRSVHDSTNSWSKRGIFQMQSALVFYTLFALVAVWLMYAADASVSTTDYYVQGTPIHVTFSFIMWAISLLSGAVVIFTIQHYMLPKDISPQIVASHMVDTQMKREKAAYEARILGRSFSTPYTPAG